MSAPSVRELLVLDPDPAAAGAARRFVSGCLEGVPDDAVATAELVVSELVTNAILHAGTALRVGVERREDVVRLEIDDGDESGPVPKNYSPDAGTGRGLLLVDALTRAWGVVAGPQGKTVWAEVPIESRLAAPAPRPRPGSRRRAAGAHDPPERRRGGRRGARQAPHLVDVHLVAFPVAVYARAAEHSDELQREFALLLEREPDQGAGPPGRLLDLVREVQERFGRFGADAERVVRGAVEEGRESLADVVYQVPAEVGPASGRLGRLLEEADAYCRAGDLLTLAAPSEARIFRQWFLAQFESQAEGRAAVAWPDWVSPGGPGR